MAELGKASKALGCVGPSSGNNEIKAARQDFIARHNDWDAESGPEVVAARLRGSTF